MKKVLMAVVLVMAMVTTVYADRDGGPPQLCIEKPWLPQCDGGTPGPAGPPGTDGTNGTDGKRGATGAAGPQGLSGNDATADGGVAGVTAIASIGHARLGQNMVGVGLGHYGSGDSIAIGGSTSWDRGMSSKIKEVSADFNVFWSEDDYDNDVGVGGAVNFHF